MTDLERKNKQGLEHDWLESRHPDMVGAAVGNRICETINGCLRVFSSNFSPEECADIVIKVLSDLAVHSDFRENLVTYVKTVQSARK